MIRKLFICILFLVIGALAQANFDLSPTLASNHDLALQYMTVVEGPINGMPGPHIIITGANLHIRSGEGVTNGANTGVGNVVVGYNEEPGGGLIAGDRDGTHNLIVGPQHKYLNFGGFLAGIRNTTSGDYASVSGGNANTASGLYASVSGGQSNFASGNFSRVSGGQNNTASGGTSSVSGGIGNTASANFASVSGGSTRTAAGDSDWVAGTLLEDF